jgi:elongation factor G
MGTGTLAPVAERADRERARRVLPQLQSSHGSSLEGHHRHKKQTGGAGQFGEVFLRVEPLARGQGFQFVDEVKGGTIPTQFIPAVEKGVQQVLFGGPLGGYQVQDLKVTVYDGKHHPVDSKEIAFITAGKRALLDAIAKARPIVSICT